MNKVKDITNQKFFKLTPIEVVGKSPERHAIWRCKCDCGNFCNVRGNDLRNGKRKSCGCLHKSTYFVPSDEHFPTKLIRKLKNMVNRCYNEKHAKSKNYKEKNIQVCNEWLENPKSFYKWAIENGWKEGLTIDRVNNNGDYSPENCRFISRSDNSARNGGKNVGKTFGVWKVIMKVGYSNKVMVECINCRQAKYADQWRVTSLKLSPCIFCKDSG